MIAFATALKANSAVKSLNLGRPLLHSQQVIKNIDYQQVHFMNFHSGGYPIIPQLLVWSTAFLSPIFIKNRPLAFSILFHAVRWIKKK